MFRKPLILLLCAAAALAAPAKPRTVVPAPLQKGDTIAIISPASCIDSAVIDKAVELLSVAGYVPLPMPHAYGHEWGSYSATDSARAADVMQAFERPGVKAIMCSRGGYGSARLLPLLDAKVIAANPKWLIGYSDISALHAFMTRTGVASIHGPMCGHISSAGIYDSSMPHLMAMLSKGLPHTYKFDPNQYDHYGSASGTLAGGNVMVINGLAETEWDIMMPRQGEDIILFIEDVGEKIYAIERWLVRMHQSGMLNRLKGLVIGEFTEYEPDEDFESMEQMIHHWLSEWGYYDKADFPVLFYFPAGHGEPNFPIPMGAQCDLVVTPDGSTITFR